MDNVYKFLGKLDFSGLKACLLYMKNSLEIEEKKIRRKLTIGYVILFVSLFSVYLMNLLIVDGKNEYFKIVLGFFLLGLITVNLFIILRWQKILLKIGEASLLTKRTLSKVVNINSDFLNVRDPFAKMEKFNSIEYAVDKYIRKLSIIFNIPVNELKEALINQNFKIVV